MTFVVAFLKDLSDQYSNDGSNDLFLKATNENIELAKTSEENQTGETDIEFKINNGKICCNNMFVVDELADRVMKEFDIKEKELPRV